MFVEKPMAQTVEEAETLVRTAKDQQLFVGHIFLYHPIYTKVKELCAKDPAVSMNAVWNKTGTFDEDIIQGLVSHDIALAIGLFDAMPVKADLIMKKGIVTEADIVKINVSFSGKKCTIETNRMFPKKSKIITIETQSGAVYYWIDDELYKLNGDKFDLIFESKEEPLKIELQAFLNAIKKNTPLVTDGAFGLKVMKALELIG